MTARMYNTTTSSAIVNAVSTLMIAAVQASGTPALYFQQTAPIGPVFITIAGSTQSDIHVHYSATCTDNLALIGTDSNGASISTAVRIA